MKRWNELKEKLIYDVAYWKDDSDSELEDLKTDQDGIDKDKLTTRPLNLLNLVDVLKKLMK